MADKQVAGILTIVGGVFYLIGTLTGALIISAFLQGLSGGLAQAGSSPSDDIFALFGPWFVVLAALGLASGALIILGGVLLLSDDPGRRRLGRFMALAMMIVGAVPTAGGGFVGFILTLVGVILGFAYKPPVSIASVSAVPSAVGTEAPSPSFCRNCGAPVTPGAKFCESCGQPLVPDAAPPQGVVSSAGKGDEEVSSTWWLLPVFVGLIGGVIAYALVESRNRKKATRMLVVGIVITAIGVGATLGVFVYALNSVSHLDAGAQTQVAASIYTNGQGPDMLNIGVNDGGAVPITGFNVTGVSPNLPGVVGNFTLMCNGTSLSKDSIPSGTTIPAGGVCSGTLQLGSVVAGQAYTIVAIVYYQNGGSQLYTLVLSAPTTIGGPGGVEPENSTLSANLSGNGTGPGTLFIEVSDTGIVPITGFDVTSVSPSIPGLVNHFILTCDGKALSTSSVSSGTSIPVGGVCEGELTVSPVTVGVSYTVVATVYYQDGYAQAYSVQVTAASAIS